jgi:hypothetical protein
LVLVLNFLRNQLSDLILFSPALGDVKLKDTFTYLDTWCRGPANRADSIKRVKENMATSKVFRTTLWTGVVLGVIISGWRTHYLGKKWSCLPSRINLYGC